MVRSPATLSLLLGIVGVALAVFTPAQVLATAPLSVSPRIFFPLVANNSGGWTCAPPVSTTFVLFPQHEFTEQIALSKGSLLIVSVQSPDTYAYWNLWINDQTGATVSPTVLMSGQSPSYDFYPTSDGLYTIVIINSYPISLTFNEQHQTCSPI
jgi:hypothetical protein